MAFRLMKLSPLYKSSVSSVPSHPTSIAPLAHRAQCQIRHSSHSPTGLVSLPKVTLHTLHKLHQKQEPITMITAHDFPSAHVADAAGIEMILVGDSLAMVAMGMEDTSEVMLDEMILHCRSVSRATKSAFTVLSSPHKEPPKLG